MQTKSLVILGSTGSIGRHALEVVALHPGAFSIRALAAHSNMDLLLDQYRRFRPEYLCLIDRDRGAKLAQLLENEQVEVVVGEEAMVRLAGLENVDIVLNAVVGAAGLLASVEAVSHGRRLALANKESLVAGRPLFPGLCQKSKAKILPIDSEHSAIWQALNAGKESEVKTIILTSSGGPFRTYSRERLARVTLEEALSHPTWRMGQKITVDSATLANKGLEVIEAMTLFSVSVEMIQVLIHPQSIIHSMVEFCDSSVIAQLSQPDMRLPISYALFWPDRVASDFGQINWAQLPSLSFEEPDLERFPALRLAFDVAGKGGSAPAVYSAANEVAVEAFLNGSVSFPRIADIIQDTLSMVETVDVPGLEDILEADRRARETAGQRVKKLSC